MTDTNQERTEADKAAFLEQLRSSIGGAVNAPLPARDAVNQAMIRHWSDAMTDFNPVYLDADYAAKSSHGDIVAPPAMLNAWGMPGLIPPEAASKQRGVQVYAELDAAGYTSVVATNSEHTYNRYLKLGELVHGSMSVVDVTAEKKTALGIGHFVTTRTEYTTASGEVIGAMTFRILKFKPGTGRMAQVADADGTATPRTGRPQPGVSRDNRFFWDGIAEGELRIQKCDCGALHHPPMVRCPKCGAYDLGYVVASGRPRPRDQARLARYFHEHFDVERLEFAVCHRLGGPRRDPKGSEDSTRRSKLPVRHDDHDGGSHVKDCEGQRRHGRSHHPRLQPNGQPLDGQYLPRPPGLTTA
jgi:acyl dehydratase